MEKHKNIELKKSLLITYHTYDEFGKHILKISHWFYFTTHSSEILKPQLEEDITSIEWIKTKDIKQPVSNTYENIKDILRAFFDEP